MPKTRAKMECREVVRNSHGYWNGKSAQVREIVKLSVVGDNGTPENERFYGASPVGELELHVDNPAVHGMFTPGQAFYVDITPAE